MAELGLEPRKLALGTPHSSPLVSFLSGSRVPPLSNDRASLVLLSLYCGPSAFLSESS